MKYLQIYDHLGNLVKEFEVFVDGQDFTWAAPKPEPVWLGTIRLSASKAAEPIEPTPEVVAVEREEPVMPEHPTIEPHDIEVDRKLEAYQEAQDIKAETEKAIEPELEPESAEGEAEQEPEAPFTTPSTTTEPEPESQLTKKWEVKDIKRGEVIIGKREKVKHEPEKRSHKGRRSSRSSSSTSS